MQLTLFVFIATVNFSKQYSCLIIRFLTNFQGSSLSCRMQLIFFPYFLPIIVESIITAAEIPHFCWLLILLQWRTGVLQGVVGTQWHPCFAWLQVQRKADLPPTSNVLMTFFLQLETSYQFRARSACQIALCVDKWNLPQSLAVSFRGIRFDSNSWGHEVIDSQFSKWLLIQ